MGVIKSDGTYLRPCGCLWTGDGMVPLVVCEEHSRVTTIRCWHVGVRDHHFIRCTKINMHGGDHRFD